MIKEITNPPKMSVHDALKMDDPLFHISNNINDDTPEQQLFHLLYAAILDVNSAGSPSLFDRYDEKEIETVYLAYQKLGAKKICADIDRMRDFIKAKLGDSYSEDNYFDLWETDDYHQIDRELTLKYEEVVDEMEEKLLVFVKQNIDQLEKNPNQ